MRLPVLLLMLLCLTVVYAYSAEEYTIRPGDTLDINVAGEPDLTKKTVVRPDGKMAVGLIGDIKAAGLTPDQLRANLEAEFKKYIKRPKVTVEVTGYDTAAVINVMGAVRQPGQYPLRGKIAVTDALALAGGTTERAKVKEISVVRANAAGNQKTTIDLAKMVSTGDMKDNLLLQPGDTVYVPEGKERPDWLRIIGTVVSVGYLLSK